MSRNRGSCGSSARLRRSRLCGEGPRWREMRRYCVPRQSRALGAIDSDTAAMTGTKIFWWVTCAPTRTVPVAHGRGAALCLALSIRKLIDSIAPKMTSTLLGGSSLRLPIGLFVPAFDADAVVQRAQLHAQFQRASFHARPPQPGNVSGVPGQHGDRSASVSFPEFPRLEQCGEGTLAFSCSRYFSFCSMQWRTTSTLTPGRFASC